MDDLLLVGTSMGGIRPKAVVEDEDGLWLAKFNRADDRWNMAQVGHAMLQLGRACGLSTAESRVQSVGNWTVLLVKRFDRERQEEGCRRARMVSALALLRADDGPSRERWSYVLLAEELRRMSAEPKRDAAELFCRMVFNALISNIDDHPRNHAALAPGRYWRLSPAYDLTPVTPISLDRRDLAMSCGDHGRQAASANLLSQSRRFLIEPAEAATIVQRMAAQVAAQWHEVARGVGVTPADCERIRGAFVYLGFEST